MNLCPNCQREQLEGAAICPYCGTLLALPNAKTTVLNDDDVEDEIARWGTARFNERMNLRLSLRDGDASFVYDAAHVDELLLGRFDPDSGEAPDLDLQPFGASELGVSRRHAAIIRREGALHLVDLGAPNGTFLNGQKLIPHQPRILRDGDDVRLGRLVITVRYSRAG